MIKRLGLAQIIGGGKSPEEDELYLLGHGSNPANHVCFRNKRLSWKESCPISLHLGSFYYPNSYMCTGTHILMVCSRKSRHWGRDKRKRRGYKRALPWGSSIHFLSYMLKDPKMGKDFLMFIGFARHRAILGPASRGKD